MNLCNTAVLKLYFFEISMLDFSLDYEFLLPILNNFTVDTVRSVSYKVNDAKSLKNLGHNCSNI